MILIKYKSFCCLIRNVVFFKLGYFFSDKGTSVLKEMKLILCKMMASKIDVTYSYSN